MADHNPPNPPIVNLEDVLADPTARQENRERGPFQATIGMIGHVLRTRDLGVNVTVVPPGKTAWPRHYHFANEELFVILSGSGALNYGDAQHPLRPGDVVSIRAGEEIPFQITNPGCEELRYLAFSTMHPADVCVYPDSGKVGVFQGPQLRKETGGRARRVAFLRGDATMRYWEGEVDDEA